MNKISKLMLLISISSFALQLFGQEWHKKARISGSSMEEKITGDDESGAYQVLTNWEKGYMEFSASATADMSKVVNDGQAISQSKETARYLAYVKAVDYLEGVFIKKEIKMGGTIAISDKAIAQVKGNVKNAVIVGENFEWRKSISTGEHYPWATVTLGILLYGGKPDQNLIASLFTETVKITREAGISEYILSNKEIKKVTQKYPDLNQEYTGIIIDTRGFHYKPTIAPSVMAKGTKLQVYGNLKVSREYVSQYGIAGFATNLESAKDDDRVKRNGKSSCYIIKPMSVNNENHKIEISKTDASIIIALNNLNKFLKEGRVMIVVDK